MAGHEKFFPCLALRLNSKRSLIGAFAFLSFFLLYLPLCLAAAPAIPFTVTMSEPVTIGSCTEAACPYLSLNVDGNTRFAYCPSVTNTATVTCTYTATAGDLDLDGIGFVDTNLHDNGISITDQNGNALTNFAFTPPANISAVKVSYPSLSMDFTNGTTGRYTLNGTAYNSLASFLTASSGTFSRASTATYFDSTGTLQTAAANTPRFDYDPSTLAFKGLLLEPGRTNGVRNNTMVGAVAGTPGTLPTYWAWTGVNGLSVSVVGTGTQNGINYIDIRFFGTTTTSGPRGVQFNGNTSCTAAPSGYNSISAYMRIQAGSTANINLWYLIAGGMTAAGASTGEYRAGTPVIGTGSLNQQRYVSKLTFTNASTAAIFPYLELYPTGTGVAIDVTVRIGMPQCEQGNFATSVIPTSSGAVARSADNLTIPTGSWYNQSAGSFFQNASWSTTSGSSYPMFWRVDDATTNNRWNLYYSQAGNSIGVDAYNSSVSQGSFARASSVTNSAKVAAAQAANSANASFNNNLQTLDTSWTPPTVTRLFFLNGYDSVLWLNQTKYYPLRVSDSQLQLLTQ